MLLSSGQIVAMGTCMTVLGKAYDVIEEETEDWYDTGDHGTEYVVEDGL